MILTCPACATSYFVPDTAIGPEGRRVRCKSCGHDWRAITEDAPLDLGEVAAAIAPPMTEPEPEPAPVAPKPLPQAFRQREQEKRRTRQAIRQGLSWGLLVIIVLTGLTFAYVARDSIVSRVPQLASAYKLFGIETNVVGLEFEAVNARYAAHDTSRVVVSGAVRNIRDHEVVVPAIRISIRDNVGREIGYEMVRLDAPPVLPGAVQGFAAILPNPEGQFASAATTFVIEDKPPVSAPAAKKTSRTEAEVMAAQPAAVDGKLTPASAGEGDRADGLRRIGTLPAG